MRTHNESTSPQHSRVARDPILWLTCGLGVLVIACIAGVAPVLPRIAKVLDIPLASIGGVNSAFMLPGLFIAPLAGLLGDRFGQRAVLVPSLLLLCACGSACYLATSHWQLLALRLGAGCGAGAVSVLTLTILGERFQGTRLLSATAIFGFVQTLSTAIIPPLGGILGSYAWNAPFLLALLALPLALASWRLLTPRAIIKSNAIPEARSLKAVLGVLNKPLLAILLVEFVNFALLTGSLLTYVPVALRSRFGFGPKEIGLMVAFAATVSAVAALSTKKLGKHLPAPSLVATGFALYVPAYVIAALAQSVEMFLVAAALLGLGRGLNLPSLIRMVNEQSPREHRALCNAAYLFTLRAGQTTGPLLAGLFFAFAGILGVFFIDAAVSVLAVIMAFMLPRVKKM